MRFSMDQTINLKDIDANIQSMIETAEVLKRAGDQFPALEKNISRILASLKMLEINVSDIVDL